MAGHGPPPVIAAVERQLRRGITTMLPTEDAAWVGEELTRRFGLPAWQFTLTATELRSALQPALTEILTNIHVQILRATDYSQV